jgi:hypothetical protein
MPRFLPMRCAFAADAGDIVAKGAKLLPTQIGSALARIKRQARLVKALQLLILAK